MKTLMENDDNKMIQTIYYINKDLNNLFNHYHSLAHYYRIIKLKSYIYELNDKYLSRKQRSERRPMEHLVNMVRGDRNHPSKIKHLAWNIYNFTHTTRKHRHTERKNRRYVVGITLFRRHTDKTCPRK